MENVAYIEIQDIDSQGNLKPHVGKGKPVVVMALGTFCGYCNKAKPAFEEFARLPNNVVAGAIQIDGDEPDKKSAAFLKKWHPGYRGVPTYLGFDGNGKFSKVHTGGRDLGSISTFSKTL